MLSAFNLIFEVDQGRKLWILLSHVLIEYISDIVLYLSRVDKVQSFEDKVAAVNKLLGKE